MPPHQDLINNTANFLANNTYNSNSYNCTNQLTSHATFLTGAGGSGGLGVDPANIPAVNFLAVNGAINTLHARVRTGGGLGARRWDWFDVTARPPNSPMTWGWLQAYVDAEFAIVNADPGGLGTQRQRRAYYLPYRQNGITETRLANNADFAFTAPLGGCTVYVYRPLGAGVRFYHANAGDVAAGQKQAYMDHMFHSVSGVLATAPTVSVYRSNPHINIPTNGTTWAEVRKRFQLRKNVHWFVPGATVTGRRTGHDTWSFHWQTVKLLSYDRRPTLEAIRGLFKDGRLGHVDRLRSLTVYQTGAF